MTINLGKVYAALKAAGTPEAEAMAAAEEREGFGSLRSVLHEMHADMKGELSGLRSEIGELRGDLRSVLSNVRTEVRSGLSEPRSEFRGEVGGVRAEIAYMRGRFDVLIWAVGMNAAATVAILGVLLQH